jgi:sugar phosphate isomerase/epimerase
MTGGIDSLEIGLCWGTLQNASLLELIEAAGRHGFPTLSVRTDTVLTTIGEGTSEAALRRRLRDAGVRVQVIDALSAGLPGMQAPAAPPALPGRGSGGADEETCFRVAEIVGAPVVNIALYGGDPVSLSDVAEAVSGVAARAAQRGLAIVLEFIPGTAMPDLHAAMEIVRACATPNCRVLLDTWHLARSGGSLTDLTALPPGMLGAIQLSDRTPLPPGAPYVPMTGRDLPGEGQLPLLDIVRAALANTPGLTAEIEVFSAELRDLPLDAAAARVAGALSAWRGQL